MGFIPSLNFNMKSINKKGQAMQQLGALGVGVAVLAITMAVVFLILAQSKEQINDVGGCYNDSWTVSSDGTACCELGNCTTNNTAFSYARNGTDTLTNAVADIPGWVPLIIIAVVGAILLGLISLFRG